MAEAKNGNMTDEEQKQYDRLIAARNYHYDNLNKWMMTFYVIIGALFVAFQAIHCGEHLHRHLELGVAIAGYIISIAAVLSGKGYYYWETNWIRLVQEYENNHVQVKTERVYSIFANMSANNFLSNPTKGANVSTSKVALAMTFVIAVLWGTIVIYMGTNLLGWFKECSILLVVFVELVISTILTWSLIIRGIKLLPSRLGNLDDLKLKDKK